MSELQNQLQEIIPAIRMIISGDSLVSIKTLPENRVSSETLKEKLSGREDFTSITISSEKELESRKKEISRVLPAYLHLEGLGVLCCAETKAQADALYEEALSSAPEKIGQKTASTGSYGRVSNRVIIITGAAQGFGKGIALDLFHEGANIVIADLNEEAGKELEAELNSSGKANKALFVRTDVSKPESVQNLVSESVLEFGGLDAMISNAGVLRAGGLDEMDPSTFEFMTKVNYTGYFYCAKYASAIMKIQGRYSSGHFFDILQINSKSGLKGSKKNFAYAGGKFGGIGLTQSFALELMPDKIKVNSVCPGNFFDGPLWSDPETGLFVQYLNAGKVPGAKSIEDVKKFYEAQVPAGRGCEVKDVSRAILYAIEQEYETGQAIPVTGGQNMLS